MELESFCFKPLAEEDFELLYTWLRATHVANEWGAVRCFDEVKTKYLEKIRSDWQRAFIVAVDGNRFGYVQVYEAQRAGPDWWPDEPKTTVGMDAFIGEERFLGRGFGTRMIRSFSDWLLEQPLTTKVISDPSVHNSRAVRCYEKAGFVRGSIVYTPAGPAQLMEKAAASNGKL